MTKKQLPLIGRIQEKLAGPAITDTPAGDEARPREPDALFRGQADWLLERIRRTSAQFQSLAEHGSLARTGTSASPVTCRQQAFLLGYKLTVTAWRRRDETKNDAVLNEVRTRVLRELEGIEQASETNPDATSGSQPADTRLREIRKALERPTREEVLARLAAQPRRRLATSAADVIRTERDAR